MNLTVEIGNNDRWMQIGPVLEPGDLAGSMSDNSSGKRDVILFFITDDYAVVERSIGGTDTDVGPLRAMHTIGFEMVAMLMPGDTCELPIQTDRMRDPATLRFKCAA